MSWKNRIFAEKVQRHKSIIMKFIHTADWHIGQHLKQYSRTDEHSHFFKQLEDLVKKEQPDALLVCGDVYHNATPDNAAVRTFTEAMVMLHEACQKMRIVVIAGNHDSPGRLEANAEIFRYAKVDIIGTMSPDNLERHIVTLPDVGHIIAVPHHYARNNGSTANIFEQLLQTAAERNESALPVVMMAHLFVNGADITGHQSGNVGGMEAADINQFGAGYDYLALGHIHRPQNISNRIRYSGSPLHVSFAERYPHSVTVVNISKHGETPQLTEHRIHQLKHLYHVPEDCVTIPFDKAITQLNEFNPKEQGYVTLHVKVQKYLPTDAQTRVDEIMREKENLYFADFNIEFEDNATSEMTTVLTTTQLRQMTPIDVAKKYYLETRGTEMPQHMIEKLKEVAATN